MKNNQQKNLDINAEIISAEERFKLSELKDQTVKLQEKYDYWQSKIDEAKKKFEFERRICFEKKNKLLSELDSFIKSRRESFKEKEKDALIQLDEKISLKSKLEDHILKLKESKLSLLNESTIQNEKQFYLSQALKHKESDFIELNDKVIQKEEELFSLIKETNFLNEKIVVNESKETQLYANVSRIKKIRKQLSRDLSREKKKINQYTNLIERQKAKVSELEESINEKQCSLNSKLRAISKKESRLKDLSTNVEELIYKDAQLELSVKDKISQVENQTFELKKIQEEQKNAMIELCSIENKNVELKSWIESSELEYSKLSKDVELASKRKSKLTKKVSELEVLQNSLEIELNTLHEQKIEMDKSLLDVISEIDEANAKLCKTESLVAKKECDYSKLEEANLILQLNLKELEIEKNASEAFNSKLKEEAWGLDKLVVDKTSKLKAVIDSHDKSVVEFNKIVDKLRNEELKLKKVQKENNKFLSLVNNIVSKKQDLKKIKEEYKNLESKLHRLSLDYSNKKNQLEIERLDSVKQFEKFNQNLVLIKEKHTIAHNSLIDIEKDFIERKMSLEYEFEEMRTELETKFNIDKDNKFEKLNIELDSYKNSELEKFNQVKRDLLEESESIAKGLIDKSKSEVSYKLKEVKKSIDANLLEVQSFIKDKYEVEFDLAEFKNYQGSHVLKKRLFSQSKRTNQFWWGVSSTVVASLMLLTINIVAPEFSRSTRSYMANLILDNGNSARAIASIAEQRILENKYSPVKSRSLKASILDNVLKTSNYNEIWSNEKFQESLMIELSEFFLFKLHVDDSLAIEVLNDQLSLFESFAKESSKLTLSNKSEKIQNMNERERLFNKKLSKTLSSSKKVKEYHSYINQFYLNYLNQKNL